MARKRRELVFRLNVELEMEVALKLKKLAEKEGKTYREIIEEAIEKMYESSNEADI